MPKPADEPEFDDIPELEDVVDAPADAGNPAPPPNLDMFADTALERAAIREALAERLAEEIETALGGLRAEFEEALRLRVEECLLERLPEIIDDILGAPAEGNSNKE